MQYTGCGAKTDPRSDPISLCRHYAKDAGLGEWFKASESHESSLQTPSRELVRLEQDLWGVKHASCLPLLDQRCASSVIRRANVSRLIVFFGP